MVKTDTIGKPVDRLDGAAKVTGKATYAAEFPAANPAYGFCVQSTIAAGEIVSIDAAEAEKSAGVVKILTHRNALKLPPAPPPIPENRFSRLEPVLQNAQIRYYGQPIGLVVAETYEEARYAARLVKVTYKSEPPKIDFDENAKTAYKPATINTGAPPDTSKGDLERGLRQSAAVVEGVYDTPIEVHNPMEPHASIAAFNGEKLLIYESTQMLGATRDGIARMFGIPKENIRVLSPYVGGGFGAKIQPRESLMMTVMAAKMINRPIKTAITRQMMQTSVGLRQMNRQKMRVAATKDGKLTALAHESLTHTAVDEDFVEQCGLISRLMYDVPNSLVTHRVFKTHIQVPRWTRAPGEATGSFPLESAIDELAYRLKIDPIELRIKNEPEKNPENNKPWGSRSVVECMRTGAKRFGWARRKFEPRAQRDGRWLVGYGMSPAVRNAPTQETSARVKLTGRGGDVRALVELAATDIGTGSYTIIAQTAADALGLPMEKISVEIGDSNLPPTPGSGGSWGAANYASAVDAVCEKAKTELRSKIKINFVKAPTVADLMTAAGVSEFQTEATEKPPKEAENYAHFSFAAHFVEVWVDESLGIVRIPRTLTTVAAGRILNEKTARSQIIGGVVWGIGMTMSEETVLDKRYGSYATRSFADYHVPVSLDIGEIAVHFLPDEDKTINRLGVKGVGELGIIGVAAAVANAIFNATGKRVRELPLTPDKLL